MMHFVVHLWPISYIFVLLLIAFIDFLLSTVVQVT